MYKLRSMIWKNAKKIDSGNFQERTLEKLQDCAFWGEDFISKSKTFIRMKRKAKEPVSASELRVDGKQNVKIRLILETLNEIFPPPVPVPLNHGSQFQFLSAVCLSAQTTDVAVNLVTKNLWDKYPDAISTSTANLAALEMILQSIGLYKNKAKNLLGMSQMIVSDFAGQVPCNKEDLLKLPGVGPKTAAVYLSQMHGVPAMAVDTHVHRLALRWGLTKDAKDPNKVQKDLQNLFPMEHWTRCQLQMIYFGREYCPAKLHEPRHCPICSFVILSEDDLNARLKGQVSHATTVPNAVVLSPVKRAKNIMSYEERRRELDFDGSLTSSPNVGTKIEPRNIALDIHLEEDEGFPKRRRKEK